MITKKIANQREYWVVEDINSKARFCQVFGDGSFKIKIFL